MRIRSFPLFFCLLLVCPSCRSVKFLPVTETRTDTLRTIRVERDSIVLRDSVWNDRWRDGDTVYITRTTVRYRDRVSVKHDTLWRVRTDSVTKAVVAEQPKKAKKAKRPVARFVLFSLLVMALPAIVGLILKRIFHG